MNNSSINVGGKKLRVVRFSDPLFRADKVKYTNYSGAPLKYFTLNEAEVKKGYINHGFPYLKMFEPSEELVLVDILHKPTRDALTELLAASLSTMKNGAQSLNFSFPIKGNKVLRVSEKNEKYHDDNVVKALCTLPGVDGYYMRRLENNNAKFHSEVALCQTALPKIELKSTSGALAPPALKDNTKKRRRYKSNNNSNNNNNNYIKNKGTTLKKPRNSGHPIIPMGAIWKWI